MTHAHGNGSTGPLALSAGPLSLVYENGYVRAIRFNGIEIVRRICMALRDEHWNTIPGEISNLVIATPSGKVIRGDTFFSISFDSRHRKNGIDFLWQGEITADGSGELSFVIEGTALSAFKKNRIGLCVLHPLPSCKGRPCRVETIDGTVLNSVFPEEIAPWPIFTKVRSMSWPAANDCNVTVHFEGDVFETEDQRNWTDATYKTYSTPVALPMPVPVEKESTIRQKIIVRVMSDRHIPANWQTQLRITFGKERPFAALPLIGTTVLQGKIDDAALQRTDFSLQAFDFLRVDLMAGSEDIVDRLRSISRIYQRHRIPFEAALHFKDNCPSGVRFFTAHFDTIDFPVARFLVLNDGERTPSAATVESIRNTLLQRFPAAEIIGGTDGYFVEINRVRPPLDPVDGICFSANPQVHTFDDAAIMENLAGLKEVIHEAKTIAGEKKVVLSPLTLRPGKAADKPHKDGGHDARMKQMFGAAWVAGVISNSLGSGLSVLTVSSVDELFDLKETGAIIPSPAAVVLQWLLAEHTPVGGSIRGAKILSTDESSICGFELLKNNRFTALAANLTNAPIVVDFRGLPDGCLYSVLDDSSFKNAISRSDPANSFSSESAILNNGTISITVPPYGIIRFAEK